MKEMKVPENQLIEVLQALTRQLGELQHKVDSMSSPKAHHDHNGHAPALKVVEPAPPPAPPKVHHRRLQAEAKYAPRLSVAELKMWSEFMKVGEIYRPLMLSKRSHEPVDDVKRVIYWLHRDGKLEYDQVLRAYRLVKPL